MLALLRDGERYGFELVQTLSAIDGMVTTEGHPLPAARLAARRYYHLTPSGRDVLEAFTHEWRRFRAGIDTVLGEGDRT